MRSSAAFKTPTASSSNSSKRSLMLDMADEASPPTLKRRRTSPYVLLVTGDMPASLALPSLLDVPLDMTASEDEDEEILSTTSSPVHFSLKPRQRRKRSPSFKEAADQDVLSLEPQAQQGAPIRRMIVRRMSLTSLQGDLQPPPLPNLSAECA